MEMSDRDRLLEVLRSFGLQPETGPLVDGYDHFDNPVALVEGVTEGVDGFSRFFCVFEFAPDGSFKKVGVWE